MINKNDPLYNQKMSIALELNRLEKKYLVMRQMMII